MSEEGKESVKVYIDGRWKQLNDLTREYTNYAVKYCFATNAGGAIALLSYIGVFKGIPPEFPSLKYVLCLFLLGVLFAACPILLLLHEFDNLLQGWRKDTKQFFSEEIGYEELNKNDESRLKGGKWPWITGYISLGCFVVGILWTMGQFLCK